MPLHPGLQRILLAATYFALLCTACRSGRQTSAPYHLRKFPAASYFQHKPDIPKLISAHRGRPELPGFAENSTESLLELARRGDFIAEIDVTYSADSVLLLFHDDELDRLTLHRGPLAEHTWADLDTMRLLDPDGTLTDSTIPSFAEALRETKGKLMLTVDRKAGVAYADLARELSDYGDPALAAFITYDYDDFQEAAFSGDWLTALSVSPSEAKQATGMGCPSVLTFLGVGERGLDQDLSTLPPTVLTMLGTFGEIDSIAATDGGEIYRSLPVDIIATNTPLAAYKAVQLEEPDR